MCSKPYYHVPGSKPRSTFQTAFKTTLKTTFQVPLSVSLSLSLSNLSLVSRCPSKTSFYLWNEVTRFSYHENVDLVKRFHRPPFPHNHPVLSFFQKLNFILSLFFTVKSLVLYSYEVCQKFNQYYFFIISIGNL